MRFRYRAHDQQSKPQRGFAFGPSRQEVFDQLQTGGLRVTTLEVDQSVSKLTHNQKQWMLSHLQGLLQAGLALEQAVHSALPDSLSSVVKQDMQSDLRAGIPLSQVLEPWFKNNPDVLALLRAGEAGGRLADVLRTAEQLLREQATLRQSLQKALFYPAIVLSLLAIVLLFVLFGFLPQLQQSFADMSISTTSLVTTAWLLRSILALMILLLLTVVVAARTSRVHVPLLSGVLQRQRQSFFLQSLAAMMDQGIAMHQAVPVLLPLLKLSTVQTSFVNQSLAKGYPLSDILRVQKTWPAAVVQGIAVGEQSGSLSQQIGRLGVWLGEDTHRHSQRLLAWLEPGLLVFLTVMVGVVIWGIFTPIMGIYGHFSGV